LRCRAKRSARPNREREIQEYGGDAGRCLGGKQQRQVARRAVQQGRYVPLEGVVR